MNTKEREELDEFVPIGQQRSWRELQGIKQYITKIGLSVPSHKKRINLWSFSFKVLFRFLVETTRLFFGTGHQSMQLSGFGWLKTFNRPLFFSSTQFTVPSVSFIDVPTDRHTHHTPHWHYIYHSFALHPQMWRETNTKGRKILIFTTARPINFFKIKVAWKLEFWL